MGEEIVIFEIGDIVALNTHFYSESNQSEIIHLSGEPNQVSPLMVVVEKLRGTKNSFDENVGIELTAKGEFQYKCIWFSNKSYQFEEKWISSKLLKCIQKFDEVKELSFQIGTQVEFKTSEIELGKRKITFKQSSEFLNSTSTTAILSFVSPIMQVIGTTKNESKEPIFNPKTNTQVRWVSSRNLKCKYFNPTLNKFSEALIPIEALNSVPSAKSEILNTIAKAIEGNSYLKLSINGIGLTIINPSILIYRQGRYLLKGYDYKKSKVAEYKIEEIELEIEVLEGSYFIDELPKFTLSENKNKIKVLPLNIEHIEKIHSKYKKNILWIIYEDGDQKRTNRSVSIKKIIESDEEDDDGNKLFYLIVHCYLRDDERFFRNDRIKKLLVLDILEEDVPPIKENGSIRID